ncbi:MAG: hydroxymethylbilane synthase [Chloroflexi bacterium]|nr:hydroxymethylbilane synthase [Chloroflexota bacterium]
MKRVIRLGTRRSRLSLWQANHIANLIRRHHANVQVEIREYRTGSDRNMSAPLRSISGGGLFTDALEAALQARDIDCAVHSLKDLPTNIADGLALAAVPKRGDHRDALISRTGAGLAQLRPGARIGTGSLRRRAQLLAMRPDLKMAHIRGNVPTRLEKLRADDGRFDAIVLAAAGLIRLGLAGQISEIFDGRQMLCAAGQGALAVQCRDNRDDLGFFGPLADWRTTQATAAERAFLSVLDAGCSLPVAAYAHVEDNRLLLQGRVIALDGSGQVDVAGDTGAVVGAVGISMAQELGAALADKALAKGAQQILAASETGNDR